MIKEENINCTVEALILAAPEPVSIKKLCEVLDELSPARIRQAVSDLNNIYMGCGNSFRIREVAGGYQIHILPDFEQPIKRLLVKQRTVRLTRAALETLAIIAYKQPVTKIEIEHIRGVATDGVLHNLLQRELIVIAGRSESPGRPLLYKTSSEFLKFFGLNRLSDLPRMDEIEEMIRMAETPRDQTELPFKSDREDLKDEEDFEEGSSVSDEDGDMEDMIASADLSDFIGEVDDAGDTGNGTDRVPAGDNGDESPEADAFHDEVASEADEVVNRTLPVVAYYEPIPDEPPAIFLDSQIVAGGDNGGNGSSPKEPAAVASGTTTSSDQSSDVADKSSED